MVEILSLPGVLAPGITLVVPSHCAAQGISVLDSDCDFKFSGQILETFFVGWGCISPLCVQARCSADNDGFYL